jgi:Ca2+/H+ antiporter, TMEM165/GDT1 family
MGDKTQLLAMLLAARFRRPWPIVWGILVATLANHALAGLLGEGVARALGPDLAALDRRRLLHRHGGLDAGARRGSTKCRCRHTRLGVFGTTVIAFFIAEMGDKTQIATVALAARYADLPAVVAGTTLGMMLANVPVVFFGDRLTRRLSMNWVRGISAAVFAALGVLTLLNVGQLF